MLTDTLQSAARVQQYCTLKCATTGRGTIYISRQMLSLKSFLTPHLEPVTTVLGDKENICMHIPRAPWLPFCTRERHARGRQEH